MNCKLWFAGMVVTALVAGGEMEMLDAQMPPPEEVVTLRVDDQLLAGDDSFALIEPLWWTVDIDGTFAEYEKSLSGFSRPQRWFHAIHWYLAEVNNGGHDQFYFNSSGIVWRDALEGLDAIGATKIAKLLRKSASRLGGEPPYDRQKRGELLDKLQPDFEDLDDAFYQAQESIDLNQKMLAYARSHAKDFYFAGEVRRPAQSPAPSN